MIIDTFSNCNFYSCLNPGFNEVFDFIRKTDLAKIPPGRHQLKGEIYYLIQEYETKPESEGFFEAHRKFIDIQYIISGRERHDYAPISALKQRDQYNDEKDILFYDGKGMSLLLEKGCFTIYFPQDAHKPNLRPGSNPEKNKKAVFKIPVL